MTKIQKKRETNLQKDFENEVRTFKELFKRKIILRTNQPKKNSLED